VILDKAGNLYGTALFGGLLTDCASTGCGVVFKLTPGAIWTETILHNFIESDGALPSAGLIFDNAGNLYGTTMAGGASTACQGDPANGCGAVFRLSPSGGAWVETTLHSFYVKNTDGAYPSGALTLHGGQLFGTTDGGGTHDQGTVFELTISKTASSEKVIYSFAGGTDGDEPSSAVVFDNAGNLYGTTDHGANTDCNGYGCGAVFELTPSKSTWTETLLYRFTGSDDGANPGKSLIVRNGQSLLGTTSTGGVDAAGLVFELGPID
jgi:uncharacterized repeat protein (TIGR03803 family)